MLRPVCEERTDTERWLWFHDIRVVNLTLQRCREQAPISRQKHHFNNAKCMTAPVGPSARSHRRYTFLTSPMLCPFWVNFLGFLKDAIYCCPDLPCQFGVV